MNTPAGSRRDPVTDAYVVLERVRTAWYEGRPVVPIIGAGFSADSGYPILNSICRYFARFRYALQHNLLLPQLTKESILQADLEATVKRAREEPIHYIERFGWPDRFDLAQKVACHVCGPRSGTAGQESKTNYERIEAEIANQYGWLAEKSCLPRAANHWRENVAPKLRSNCRDWDRWASQGDWRRLVQFFTGHRGHYGDGLFAQFGFLRSPGPGHRYVTLLIKLLSVKTVFTFNFDDLIEQALTVEGVPYRVFGMEHGRTLPSSGVVGDGLAVIKMHGSHHSILIDEQLDRPLEPTYIDRFYDLAGQNALLLVLGCSGDDRRLRDLIQSRARLRRGRNAEVCWLHFEPDPPVIDDNREKLSKSKRASPAPPLAAEPPASRRTVGEGSKESKSSFLACPTNSPAAFVRHLLYHITGRFPESTRPYSSHPTTPVRFGKCDDVTDKLRASTSKSRKYSFQSNLNVKTSELLLELGTACVNNKFVVVWVDLEAVHTLAGLVGAIIDGCRRVDAGLAPAVMPLGKFGESREDAVAKLEHALQRQPYAILVDGLNVYGSSLLMHHGSRDEETARKEAADLSQFLEELNGRLLGQSIIVASVVGHSRRRASRGDVPGPLLSRPPGVGIGADLFWACLATVRRTRPLPSLRRLLAPLVPGGLENEAKVDEYLRTRLLGLNSGSEPVLQLLEGGDVWFHRKVRDKIYDYATRFTSKDTFELLAGRPASALGSCALAQSLLVGLLHRKIASTYFTFEFMQSGDAASFLEYTYHRNSSVRYISRAIYLLKHYPDAWGPALKLLEQVWPKPAAGSRPATADVFDACKYFGKLWREVSGKKKASDALGFLRGQRVRELEALGTSWKEFEQTVRSQIPAEQLIRWTDEILEPVFMDRLSGVYVGGGRAIPDDHDDTITKCEELKEYFSRLRARVYLERGDFGLAERSLDEVVYLPANKAIRLLDLAECLVRAGEIDRAKSTLERLDSEGLTLGVEDGHRRRHVHALVALGGRSWMEHGVVDGVLTSPGVDYEEAAAWAEEGIEEVRGPGAILANPLDGMIVSSGSPGGAYRPYRSVFRTLKGRTQIARMLSVPIADTNADSDLAAFRLAMRQFDQAKGGLTTQDAVLRGWSNLHAAEATLLFVRRTFDRAVAGSLGVIEAKLRSCRTQLQSGIAALRIGRRNALWWKHFYQLVAQYHTERLFVDLCRLDHHSPPPPDGLDPRSALGTDLLRRFSKALEAVAAFADYSLSRAMAFETAWLRRTLREIHLGATVAIASYEAAREHSKQAANKMRESNRQLLEVWLEEPLDETGFDRADRAANLLANTVTRVPWSAAPELFETTKMPAIVDALWRYSVMHFPRAVAGNSLRNFVRKPAISFTAQLRARTKSARSTKKNERTFDDEFRWRREVVRAARC